MKNLIKLIHRSPYHYALLTGVCIVTPTFQNLPIKYVIFSIAILLLKFSMRARPFPDYLIWAISVSSFTYVIYDFKKFFDIEVALTFLTVLQSLKYLEAKSKRDLFAFYNILLLVICAQILFNQDIISSSIAMVSTLLVLYGLLQIENPTSHLANSMKITLKQGGKYLLMAVPLTIVLFLIFPRVNIQMANLKKSVGQSGFSDDALPGQVAKLQLSDNLIFRANFENKNDISLEDLYWVGAVLWENNGYHWRGGNPPSPQAHYPNKNLPIVNYQIFSENRVNEFLIMLDTPMAGPQIDIPYHQERGKTFKLKNPTTHKLMYKGQSALGVHLNYRLNGLVKEYALKYPEVLNTPELLKLVEQLKGKNQIETLNNILSYFTRNEFKYTLEPGYTKSLEEFLFKTKIGFCQHFASAFSLLARMSGIPSRLVVGFQGGTKNEIGNYWMIKGKDAHAWSEAYLPGKGWVRYDPVNAVQPLRIQLGSADYFDLAEDGTEVNKDAIHNKGGLDQFLQEMSFLWDSIDNKWQRFIYSFDREYQNKLAKMLHTDLKNLYMGGFALVILILFSYVGLFYWREWMQLKNDPIQKLYRKFLTRMEKIGHPKHFSEGPNDYLIRLKTLMPENKRVEKIIQLYVSLQYSSRKSSPKDLNSLKQLVNNLKKI